MPNTRPIATDIDSITGYRILRWAQGTLDVAVQVDDTGSVAARYEDTQAVAASTTYIYRVVALNAAGASARSQPVTVTTAAAP